MSNIIWLDKGEDYSKTITLDFDDVWILDNSYEFKAVIYYNDIPEILGVEFVWVDETDFQGLKKSLSQKKDSFLLEDLAYRLDERELKRYILNQIK